jgi:hypothetical protein
MERMEDISRWIVDHWKSWGIYAVILGFSNFVTWILARRKDWNEWRASRQAKADKKIDAQVLQAIGKSYFMGEPKTDDRFRNPVCASSRDCRTPFFGE